MKPDNDRWQPVTPYEDVEIDAPVRRQQPLDFQLLQTINPELSNQVRLLIALNQPKPEKRPSRLALGKIPLNHEGEAFLDYVKDQLDALDDCKRYQNKANQYIQQIAQIMQAKKQCVSRQEIDQLMQMKAQKMKLVLQQLKAIAAIRAHDCKREEERSCKARQRCEKLEIKLNKRQPELKQLEKLNLDKDQQIYAAKQKINQKQKQLRRDRFQRAIIRLQFGEEAFYRYGGRVVLSEYSKYDLYDKSQEIVRWEGGMEVLEALDLKVFLLALMVPMSMSVFDNFSAQTSVYRVMFGQDEGVADRERKDCWNLIAGTIHKNMLERKVPSVGSCINNKTRKRVVFVGKQYAFENVMGELIKEMGEFATEAMAVHAVDLAMGEDKLEGTCFQMGKLTVEYVYQQLAVKLQVEVLYSEFEAMRKEDFVVLKKKTAPRDSVFCWVDVPKALHKDRMKEVRELYDMLEKCMREGFGMMQGKKQGNATK